MTRYLKIEVIGMGIVGKATYEGLKCYGYDVHGYDIDPAKTEDTTVIEDADVYLVCVPEQNVEKVISENTAKRTGLTVVRSTTFPGTIKKLERKYGMCICHNPEFLLERNALDDFMFPDRIVIGECLPKGTFVTTKRETKHIENIREGEFVLGMDGKFHPVIRTFKRRYSGEMIRIKRKGIGIPLVLTPEHPILAARPYKEKNGNTIRPHYKRGSQVYQEKVNVHYRKYSFIPASEIREGDFILTPLAKKEWTVEKDSDSSLSRLYGYYLAEGSILGGRMVSFSFNRSEEDYIQDVKDILEKQGYSPRIVEYSHSTDVRVYSVDLARKLVKLLGKGAKHKRIPFELLRSDSSMIELLKGLWRGDGCKSRESRGGYEYFQYTTISPSLAYGVYLLLGGLGIISNIKKDKQYGMGKNDIYQINVRGKGTSRLSKLLGIPYKENRTAYKNNSFFLDGFIYTPVRKVSRERFEGFVFNLEVGEESSYLANLGTVHNCCEEHGDLLERIYKPFNAPIVRVDQTTSETIKIVANAWLTTQINFWNEVKEKCERFGVQPQVVANTVTQDRRISRYGSKMTGGKPGGKCLPKDFKYWEEM